MLAYSGFPCVVYNFDLGLIFNIFLLFLFLVWASYIIWAAEHPYKIIWGWLRLGPMGPRVADLGLDLRPIYWLEWPPYAGLGNLHTCPLHSKLHLWGCLGFQFLCFAWNLSSIGDTCRQSSRLPLFLFLLHIGSSSPGPTFHGTLKDIHSSVPNPENQVLFLGPNNSLESHDLLLWPYILSLFLPPWNLSLF